MQACVLLLMLLLLASPDIENTCQANQQLGRQATVTQLSQDSSRAHAVRIWRLAGFPPCLRPPVSVQGQGGAGP